MSPSDDIFNPFLRRFVNERARSARETRALYQRVTERHRNEPWSRPDAINLASKVILKQIAARIELPEYQPFLDAINLCSEELLAAENYMFETIEADPSKPLSLREQMELNARLRAQENFLDDQSRFWGQLANELAYLFRDIIEVLPPLKESAFTVPLISLLPSPNEVVGYVIEMLCASELADVGLFRALRDKIYLNICQFSDVPPGEAANKRLITIAEARLSPRDLVDTYLAGTPFHSFFLSPVPFAVPDEARYSGHWIIAPPGRGKTTLLHSMVMEDLKKDAAVILMDSKGDLIEPFCRLKDIAGRLIIVDPDPENPIAINPLDIPKQDISLAVSNLEYVFSSLLESKMTPLQTVLFRSILRALITAFPNPTLETFRDILTNGIERYTEYLGNLPQDLKDFFLKEFNTKIYEDRRKEIVWRLRLLLENDTMRAMMLALRTRFNIAEAMDAGKVIIINNSKARLGDQGAEFFGRFFIAQVLAAAQQRAGKEAYKKPVYFYIDECQNVISKDERIPTILDECRSQKIALILAHQRTEQISSQNVLSALANCALRFANSDDEAKALSSKLRCKPELLQDLVVGQFAAFIRDLTSGAIVLDVAQADFSRYEKLSRQEMTALKTRMQEDYGNVSPTSKDPIVRFNERPAEMEPWRLNPGPSKPPPEPSSQSRAATPDAPTPTAPEEDRKNWNDPDTGSHTDESSSW